MAKQTEAQKQVETTLADEKKPEYQPLPQMNVKAIGAKPKEADRTGKAVFCGRIWGQVTSVKNKESRSGDPYSYLVGSFRALGPDDQKYEAEKLFLPGGLMEQIESTWKSGGEVPVQFGYDIYATPDEKSAVGYRYACKTIMKTETSNVLDAMTATIFEKPLPPKAA